MNPTKKRKQTRIKKQGQYDIEKHTCRRTGKQMKA